MGVGDGFQARPELLVKTLDGGGVVSRRKFPAEREEESGGALGLLSPKEGWGGVGRGGAHWALPALRESKGGKER